MIKDFLTSESDFIHKVELELSEDDDMGSIIADAKSLPSFIRVRVREMGPLTKVDRGVWFTVTVLLRDSRDATWMRLKWA